MGKSVFLRYLGNSSIKSICPKEVVVETLHPKIILSGSRCKSTSEVVSHSNLKRISISGNLSWRYHWNDLAEIKVFRI